MNNTIGSGVVFILAGSSEQAKAYAKFKKMRMDNVRIITGPDSLRGIIMMSILAVGSWQDREDIDKIMTMVQIRKLNIAQDTSW